MDKQLADFRGPRGTGRRSAWISISRLKVGTTGCPGVNKPRAVSVRPWSTLKSLVVNRAAEDHELNQWKRENQLEVNKRIRTIFQMK